MSSSKSTLGKSSSTQGIITAAALTFYGDALVWLVKCCLATGIVMRWNFNLRSPDAFGGRRDRSTRQRTAKMTGLAAQLAPFATTREQAPLIGSGVFGPFGSL